MPTGQGKTVAGGLKSPGETGEPAVQSPFEWHDLALRAEIQTLLNLDMRDALLAIVRLGSNADELHSWDAAYSISRIAAYMRECAGADQDAWKAIYRLVSEILDAYREKWEAVEARS